MEYRYDTQLLIEGRSLDEAVILGYFQSHFQGDCLLVVGDESLIKIHFHTNEPSLRTWTVRPVVSRDRGGAHVSAFGGLDSPNGSG